jgi:DNA-binding transcriptional MerR regulator
MSDTTPTYNLKAVMHEVGLSAATLRAWELRYGLPMPQRTSGGHRLYSKQDIEILKWLVQRQQEGLSISRAVEMWKSQKAQSQSLSMPVQVPSPDISMGEVMMDQLREQWIAACSAFDDLSANQTLDQAFAIAAPETICTEVLQKGLAHFGDSWYAGSISVQQEHFASAVAVRRINSLLTAVPLPTRPGRILVACPPGEVHDFILLLITYLLRRKSWDVIYLGANVPLQDLDTALEITRPVLVLSASQTINSAASLRSMSEFLAARGIPLAFGGGVYNQIQSVIERISGYYLGSSVKNIPNIIELLVQEPPSMPVAQPLSSGYINTLNKFRQNEAFILGDVGSRVQAVPIEPSHMEIASQNLTQLIYSALMLGDINLLDFSADWLNGLLSNYGISAEAVEQFYTIYRQAIEHYLGEEGAIILDWLNKQIAALVYLDGFHENLRGK